MTREFWVSALAKNWYLLLLLVAAAAFFIYGVSGARQTPPASPPGSATDNADGRDRPPGAGLVVSDEEKTIEQIEEYRRRVEEEPRAEEAPALLAAAGNLSCQKLLDYEKAAQFYETALADYPGWEGARGLYVQLATCYERLEDWEKARRVYRRMMDAFPPESQEYQYARAKFEGSLP